MGHGQQELFGAIKRLERCQHASKDTPFARMCWYKSRDNICEWCTRVEKNAHDESDRIETLLKAETYYEHIRRVGGCGTLAVWAADLYDESGKDVETAVLSIPASGAYAEDFALIEKHIRLLPERNYDVVSKWFGVE